jgi:predicted nucleic acid-binding protein
MTLFVVRGEKVKGIEWLREVLGAAGIELVQIERTLFDKACRIYAEFADKDWSFTDCTSYAVIQQRRVTKAFSFDNHFRQFGIVQVCP